MADATPIGFPLVRVRRETCGPTRSSAVEWS